MGEDIIHVPLYLSQMRLSLITGIKGAREDTWRKYLEELESASSYLEYDLQFGNAGEWTYFALDTTATAQSEIYFKKYIANITLLKHFK